MAAELRNGDGPGSMTSAGAVDVLSELPERVRKEKEKGGGIHSIHGEQAAKRRAVAELIFFAGTNDLNRCRQGTNAALWHGMRTVCFGPTALNRVSSHAIALTLGTCNAVAQANSKDLEPDGRPQPAAWEAQPVQACT